MATFDLILETLGPCNYSCPYCVGGGVVGGHPVRLHDMERIAEVYAVLPRPVSTRLAARGGEPALHPQTSMLARHAQDAGTLRIRTNLSIPVHKWLLYPDNIILEVTLHPEAVSDPQFLYRVVEALEIGYELDMKALGNELPPGWAQKLREIGVANDLRLEPIRTGREYVLSKAPPQGTLCWAGCNSAFVGYPGTGEGTELYRCPLAQEILERPFDGPRPCHHVHADARCKQRWVS